MCWFCLPVNLDHFSLTNAMTSRLGLKIVLRIPITVVDNDGVSRR